MAKNDRINIASYLPEMARKMPDAPAVIVQGRGYTQYTFKELNEKSNAYANGLEARGIKKGTRTVLMVKPSLDFFAIIFALFKIGAVPVVIDPGIGMKNLKKCLEEAEPEAFIGIPRAHLARILFGWGRKSIRILITAGKKFDRSNKNYGMAETRADEMAAILFTSGNTGISKGAVYTHGIFDAQVKFLRSIYGIEPGEKDLATFPPFALFGPALGMTAIIPDMDASRPAQADPKKIIQAIKGFGATNMFASPALINKLGRYGVERGIKLPSLKRVISAGAPASPLALKRFSKMLSFGVEIFTPYGATEALPVCNIGSNEILQKTGKLTDQGKGSCIGRPNSGIILEIIKITDTPIGSWSNDLLLPAGEIGEIVVKGPIVTRSYYNREPATALAKIDKTWHRMGDVGYKDNSGRVWFCGRKSHRVETSEGTLFTLPCEAVFNVHPKVFRTALVGIKRNGTMLPVLCVELEKNVLSSEKNQIKEELVKLGAAHPHTSKINMVLFHPSFPVDIRHNAKIHREKLTVWAGRKLS